MICDFGDVAIVPFPFVDRPMTKNRPAVVLSNAGFNESNGNTVLVMITTAKRSDWPSDIEIEDSAAAGLLQRCYVRWKIFTLPNELLRRKIGAFADKDRKRIRTGLKSNLA